MTGAAAYAASEDDSSFPFATGRGSAERTFLVVDESRTVRVLATDILQKLGTPAGATAVAASPSEGLAAFRATRPAVVLMELDYVAEDGLPVALAMLEEDPRLKLVVLTAEPSTSERVRRIVRAGAFAVVEKPLRHEKLRAVLSDLDMEEGGIERLG